MMKRVGKLEKRGALGGPGARLPSGPALIPTTPLSHLHGKLMALRIRLTRGGAKRRPFYRIVVAEGSSPRDGRFIEILGFYNPMMPKDHEDRLRLKEERIRQLAVGGRDAVRARGPFPRRGRHRRAARGAAADQAASAQGQSAGAHEGQGRKPRRRNNPDGAARRWTLPAFVSASSPERTGCRARSGSRPSPPCRTPLPVTGRWRMPPAAGASRSGW